jgi:hypothetical protein
MNKISVKYLQVINFVQFTVAKKADIKHSLKVIKLNSLD